MSKRLYQLAKKFAPKIGYDAKISEIYPKLKKLIRSEFWYFDEKFKSRVDLIKLIINLIGVIKQIPIETINELIKNAKLVYVFEIESREFVDKDCPACDGNGDRYCDSCDDGSVDCDECNRSGEKTCDSCDGDGEIETEDGMEPCEECQGGGKVRCDECDGNGYVECRNCEGSGRESCYECDGKGQFESDNFAYSYWIYLSWDKEFNQECDIKMEMKEPIVIESEPIKAILLYNNESDEEFKDESIEAEKPYCYYITSLDEVKNTEIGLDKTGLWFRSSVPTDYL